MKILFAFENNLPNAEADAEVFVTTAKYLAPHAAESWLHAPLALLEARVAARQGDASDATVAVLRAAWKAHPQAPGDWTAIDATDGAAALAAARDVVESVMVGEGRPSTPLATH